MNPLLILLLATSALGDLLNGGPSSSYGAPAAGGPGGNGNGGYNYGAPSGGAVNGNAPGGGYSYDGDLQGAASNLDGTQQDPIAALGSNIPGGGVPGEDYPILSSVPDTGFTCEDFEFPGYFADTADEAGCQVFHICQFDGRLDSFLCPNGTIFNQQYFVCDWWFNVDCAASEQFIGLNADIGRVPEDSLTGAASNLAPSASYGTPGAAASNVAPSASYGAPEAQASAPVPDQLYGTPNRG